MGFCKIEKKEDNQKLLWSEKKKEKKAKGNF